MKEEKIVNWYSREILKDELEIKNHKIKFIEEIKKIKKGKITNNTHTNDNLWNRLKKILYTLKIVQK